MDADLEPDIAEEGADQREEGAGEKLYGRFGDIRKVLIQDPGPPIKDHGDDIRNDAFPLVAEVHGGNKQFQPPHQEDGEKREKDVAGEDRNQPEYAGHVIEFGKGDRMDKDQESHHVAADKERMKEIRKKSRGISRYTSH